LRSLKIVLSILSILGACALTQRVSSQSLAQSKRIVIAASAVLDGKGHVLHDTRTVISGSKTVAIDPKAGPVDYDLRGLTVLPGWIDVHVHIGWFFGKHGKLAGAGATPEEAAYAAASSAWVTLMAGFTTVQDMGSPITMRDTIAKGMLPGPRILTAVEPPTGRGEQTGTPDEIRSFVRKQKEVGADLIKIYASGGMRQGRMTLSQEQLNAACDEAKKQNLRTLVHAWLALMQHQGAPTPFMDWTESPDVVRRTTD
jgi:imidazolonepropionase-like amidohydrolase